MRTAAIHGGRSQGQRDRALAAFAGRTVDALVATDVAARGIHVDDVACVVHFDPPADAKDYVHRSGRTARAGATGLVVSLLSSDQQRPAAALQRTLRLPVGVDAPDLAALTPVAARQDAELGAPAPDARPVGTLTWFDRRRGFGFIARDGGPDLFMHVSAIEEADADRIAQGQRVAFFVGQGSKGEEARDVRAA